MRLPRRITKAEIDAMDRERQSIERYRTAAMLYAKLMKRLCRRALDGESR